MEQVLILIIVGILILAFIYWLLDPEPLEKDPYQEFKEDFIKFTNQINKLDLTPPNKPKGPTREEKINNFFQPKPIPSEETEVNLFREDSNPMKFSDQFCSPEVKAIYLQSNEWKALKSRRLLIANYCCEVEGCTETNKLHLHHITYKRLLSEHIDDLAILCHKHHQNIHDRLGYDRTGHYPVN